MGGVRRCAGVDTSASPRGPHPYPSPQGGGERAARCGGLSHEHRSCRLHDQDPEQRQSRRRPRRAARAGELASGLYRLVDGHGAARLPAVAGLSAHRRIGRSERLGQIRLREDARIPLGHPARAEGRGPQDSVRPPLWRAGLAGRAGRISRHAAPSRRHPGRHRARLGGAAAPSRQDRAVTLRPAQRVSGQCRGRPSPLGDGLYPAEIFRPRRPRGGGGVVAAPLRQRRQAAHARRLQRSDAGLAVVLHVHLLHRPRRQDAARESRRNRASIRCRAPAASC